MEIYLFFSFFIFFILLVLLGRRLNEPLFSFIAGWMMALPIFDFITGGYQQSYPTMQIVNATYDGSNLMNATIVTSEHLVTTQNNFTFAFGLLLIGVLTLILFWGYKPQAHIKES